MGKTHGDEKDQLDPSAPPRLHPSARKRPRSSVEGCLEQGEGVFRLRGKAKNGMPERKMQSSSNVFNSDSDSDEVPSRKKPAVARPASGGGKHPPATSVFGADSDSDSDRGGTNNNASKGGTPTGDSPYRRRDGSRELSSSANVDSGAADADTLSHPAFGADEQGAKEFTAKPKDSPEEDASDPVPPCVSQHAKETDINPEEDSLDVYMNSLSSSRPTAPSRGSSALIASDNEGSFTGNDEPDPGGHQAAIVSDPSSEPVSTTPVDTGHNDGRDAREQRALYIPLARHADLSPSDLKTACETAGVTISGPGPGVCPISSFADVALALPQPVLAQLMADFATPSAVQRGALPAALLGRDVLATAATGSGKTLAYLIPALAQAAARGVADVTRALVLAPTRELASQIARVARRFASPLGHRVGLVIGGAGKLEQVRAARNARLLVATPGRLLDLARMRAVPLHGVCVIVLDEADRMLDLGFGPQVSDVLSQLPARAQRMLFSATLPARVRRLAARALTEPLRVSAGGEPRATPLVCANVADRYVPLRRAGDRWPWLRAQMGRLTQAGLVIVFCRTRGGCAALANRARAEGVPVACVHGETAAADRGGLLRLFRAGEVRVLVTTDLAARGLDIAEVRTVVNYEPAKDWEWHVHRAGRTGRAGQTGDAYTLLAADCGADHAFANKAVAAFGRAKETPPVELREFIRGGGRR